MIRKKAMRRAVKASRRLPRLRDKKLQGVAAFNAAAAARTKFPHFFTKLRKELPPKHHLLWAIPSLLPPPTSPEKNTIFLDLDETLIHSSIDHHPKAAYYDFAVTPAATEGEEAALTWYVQKRPGVDEFLTAICRDFEVVAFTAGEERYASPVLDRLDPTGFIFSHRLYRDSCTLTGDGFLKDLSGTGRDLGRVVIVDDRPVSYAWQPENAIPVQPYLGGRTDQELRWLTKFFEDYCKGVVDMRDAVAHYRTCRQRVVACWEHKIINGFCM